MYATQEKSPMIFDIDSPFLEKLRKMPSTMKNPNDDAMDGAIFDMIQKSSDGLRSSLKVPSIKLQKIVRNNQNEEDTPQQRSKILKSEQRRKRVQFHRQRSQPMELSQHNKVMAMVESSSNNSNNNIRKRLTSLERYFEETRSIQLPLAMKNKLSENEKFLQDVKEFQNNLSRVKSVYNSIYQQETSPEMAKTQVNTNSNANNLRTNRLADTRPKPLRISQLSNQNVKRQRRRIMVDRIMKEKVREYRQSMWDEDFVQKQKQIYAKPAPIDSQIAELGHQVEKIRLELKLLKRQSRQKQNKIKLITDYFAFLN